jgi:short-subunit dehydrogenase
MLPSVGGRISSPPLTIYSASKFSVDALSEGLAAEAKMFNHERIDALRDKLDQRFARR